MPLVNWNDVDTVLLDMDGTLLDLHFDNFFWLDHLPRRYAEYRQQPEAAVKEQLEKRFASERGSLNWYCLDYWSEQLDIDIATLKREITHLIAIRPHVARFLQALKHSHRQCLLVTNAHRDSVAIKMEHIDLRPWLDEIIISHDFDAPKEDPAFWRRLHRKLGFDPQRTLFIDDTEAVLQAAQEFGIRHLLTLLQPDSQGPHREQLVFPAIHHFDEIMPPTELDQNASASDQHEP
jgi:putative hydrolase of the HAD superfamily